MASIALVRSTGAAAIHAAMMSVCFVGRDFGPNSVGLVESVESVDSVPTSENFPSDRTDLSVRRGRTALAEPAGAGGVLAGA